MEKITLNGTRYIALGDFNHLRRNLVKDIVERYEKDENGQYHLSEYDQGQMGALTHIMTEIMSEEIHAAGNPDEIRKMHAEIDREFERNRWLIVGKDPETGEKVYFRKMCEHINEDEETPVFCSQKRLAFTWTNYYLASGKCEWLKNVTGNDSLKVREVWIEYLDQKDMERLKKAIFGPDDEPEDDGSGVGQAFSPDADDAPRWIVRLDPMDADDVTMWFVNWLVYDGTLPAHFEESLKKSGMKPGDTQPMFFEDRKHAARFIDKATAEGVALKIAQLQPDMEEKLSVEAYAED